MGLTKKAILGLLLLVLLVACSDTVTPPQPQASLAVSPLTLEFAPADASKTFSITNVGGRQSVLAWRIEADQPWLSVSPASGSTAALGASSLQTVTVHPQGLAPGEHRASLVISSNGGSNVIAVMLEVAAAPAEPPTNSPAEPPAAEPAARLSLSATSLELASGSARLTITNTGSPGSILLWTLRPEGATHWLELDFENGSAVAGASIGHTIRAKPAGLPPGEHVARLEVASNAGNAWVTVRLWVAAPDPPPVSPPAPPPPVTPPPVTPPPVTPPPAQGNSSLSGKLVTANALISARPTAAEPLVLETQSLSARPSYVPGQLLVHYREDVLSTQAIETLSRSFGLSTLQAGDNGQPDLVALPEGADVLAVAEALTQDPRVHVAEPNYYLYSTSYSTLPNDRLIDRQWALAASGLPVGWRLETGASNRVVVAVIDSGFDLNHEDLRGRFLPGYDFCANSSCSATDSDPGFGDPDNYHGTHVAGIIGAIGGNGVGVSGVAHGANLRLLPIKVFSDKGEGTPLSTLIDAMRYAVGLPVTTVDGKRVTNPNPARVINLSLGGDFSSQNLQNAILEARERGAIVIASSGNTGADRVLSPAALEGVLAVGSHNSSFGRSCFSNYGVGRNGPTGVALLAPGGEAALSGLACNVRQESILSTTPRNDYAGAIGTSMAAPMVSGVAALLLSQNPSLSVSALERRLLDSAHYDSYMTRSEYGAGILRADRALGLPGPGDRVTVQASGAGNAQTSVTLDLQGGSSIFTLQNLPQGRYTLTAGARRSLYGETSLMLSPGSNVAELRLDVVP